MTKLDQIRAAEARLLLTTYDRSPILFIDGEGVYIIDEKGDRYLDLLSGIASTHSLQPPAIVETIARQSRALIHTSNLYYHEDRPSSPCVSRSAPASTVLSSPTQAPKPGRARSSWRALTRASGAARARQSGRNFWRSNRASTAAPSFHVDHVQGEVREPFAPVVPGVEFVRFNDVGDLRAKFSSDVCAILVEAIQGEGGIRPLTQEFFAEARALAIPPARC